MSVRSIIIGGSRYEATAEALAAGPQPPPAAGELKLRLGSGSAVVATQVAGRSVDLRRSRGDASSDRKRAEGARLVEIVRRDGSIAAWQVTSRATDVLVFGGNGARQVFDEPEEARLRVTSLEPGQRIEVLAAAPEATVVRRIPTEAVGRILGELADSFKLMLDDDQSSFTLVDEVHPFKIPPLERRFAGIKFSAKVRNIQSESVKLTLENASAGFPGGSIRLELAMEDLGLELEISHFPDANVENMILTLQLGFAVEDGRLTYDAVEVGFPIRIRFNGVPDFLLDPILQYSKRIRRLIESKLIETLDSAETREALSGRLHQIMTSFVSDLERFESIQVDGGFVSIAYFPRAGQ